MRVLSRAEITEKSPIEAAARRGGLPGTPTDRPVERNGEHGRSRTGRSDLRRGYTGGARVNEAARSEGVR